MFFTEGASPISLFQLPSNCGYTVTKSSSDLQMMVSYDACYITQEVRAAASLCFHQLLFLCPVHLSFFFISLSERQLCAAHVVVGQPAEARLSDEDGHACPVILTLSLLLHHRHGGADQGSGAGYRDAGSHRYFSFFSDIDLFLISTNEMVVVVLTLCHYYRLYSSDLSIIHFIFT